jgi:hypothetical protein
MEILRDTLREREQLEALKLKDPEAYALRVRAKETERKAREQVELYKKASEKERATIGTTIKKLLEEEFDAKIAAHERQASQAEEEIKKLRDRLAKRKANREKIIEEHFKDIVGENEDMKWW